jgi:peptidoglycan/LPS O-acetylase OafA/YrhL
VFLAYQAIIASRRAVALSKWATILMIGTWEATIIVALAGVDLNYLTLRPVPFLWRFDASFQWIVQKMLLMWPVLVLFPLTILSLALIETRRGSLGRRISFLGDISYSTYLLHFPLQLLFSVVMAHFFAGDSVYYSPWFMGLFFVVLIAVSLCSFRYLELPTQRLLRQISPNSATNRDAAR